MNCHICNQTVTALEAVNTHNPAQVEHAFRRDCVRAVARRCAEIAATHTPFLPPPGGTADHKLIAAAITREFGLEPKP